MLCPNCKRQLISRSSPLCNWCGAKVPEGFLYTETERQQIEQEESKRREQLIAIEKKEEREAIDSDFDSLIDLAFDFLDL